MTGRFLTAVILSAVAAACLFTSQRTGAARGASAQDASTAAAATDLPTLAIASPIGGLTQPVGVTNAGDGSNRIFVVEQGGRIRIIKNGALLSTPFLNISTRVSTGGERGLLGLAFPPDYARKGYFYVDYTNTSGDTVIARYQRSTADPDAADPSSEQILITIAQPFENHNGGQLAFGPRDGMLYVGMGDGGSGGDPGNRAQNPQELLGKILRLDVETGRPFTYTAPASNPFVNRTGFRPEIWALGLRNPWRFSFDRLTADLFIADVGQDLFEEVNFQPAASAGGQNYGWKIMEATHCFSTAQCDRTGLTLPVVEYDHSLGCSVTGGYVYRGGAFPRMQGLYFYGDFCSGRIWALTQQSGTFQSTQLLDTDIQISAFGEDEAGNLYVTSYGTGQVFSVVDNGPAIAPTPTPSPAEVRFSSASIVVGEGVGSAQIGVTRAGDPSVELFVDYATSDGTASSRSDYTTARGTLHFAPGETLKTFNVLISNDDTHEGDETVNVTLGNLVGKATLDPPVNRVLTITDDDAATSPANPLDRSDFFVRQHYLDFLNREPDPQGFAFWKNGLDICNNNNFCLEVKRIDTSAAFFLSIEFQETGFLVYRLHKAAFGNLPGRPVPIRFDEFLRDTQEIGSGVVVGFGDWQAQLERNKQRFAEEFVTRPAFVVLYPTSQTPAQYVAALDANAGNVLTPAEEAELAARLADGRETRAGALRRVADDADLRAAETNRAFVLMQYFGYLRRNPDDAPNTDFSGYNFWLAKLDSFGGDFHAAEMVKAFISSIEYRQRFGQ
jgi:glucose/arabinose dehydrogenase